MKKIILFILTISMVFTLCACGSNSTKNLTQAAEYIKEAEDSINNVAALLLEHWSTSSSYFSYYFDEEEYENYNNKYLIREAEYVYDYRTLASEDMKAAKELLGTNGSSDYYNAVKSYYTSVNNYLSLVSEFPDGYSKLTYSNAVSSCKSDCQSAYNELEFYME